MTNLQIAELLRNVSAAYQLKDPVKYKFQAIAYDRAATSIEHATSELKDLWDDGKLDDVPSIGTSIAAHLDEIFKTGKSKHFEELMKDIPSDAFTLMVLPKVGLKTAIKMIDELPKDELEAKIDEAKKLQSKVKRHLLPYAENIALEVVEWLKASGLVEKIDVLGSLRRRVATVGDIDILVLPKNSKTLKLQKSKVMDRFVSYPNVQKVIEKGEKTASILLPGNVQVDILITTPEAYGNSLQHFTGSKFHNIALREHSLKKGWSMNEFRIKKLENSKTPKIKTFKTEQELYKFLDLQYIEPELREGTGEVQASMANSLPHLVNLEDIKSDLQIHSDFDIETSHDLGVSSTQDILDKANTLNYEYIAFTEHNPSKSKHNEVEIVDILKRKREKVDKLNYSNRVSPRLIDLGSKNNWGIKVFNSLEIDINKDGSLPVPVKGLETLDFALVSIHSVFDLSRLDMTRRVINALSHPKVKIFAHPTARKINEREGVELDWEKIFAFCIEHNKWIEINADPMRLDLPDVLVRDAVKLGVKLTLGTDTHEVGMMDNMKYGIDVARRGWAEKKDVINCLNLEQFEQAISNSKF